MLAWNSVIYLLLLRLKSCATMFYVFNCGDTHTHTHTHIFLLALSKVHRSAVLCSKCKVKQEAELEARPLAPRVQCTHRSSRATMLIWTCLVCPVTEAYFPNLPRQSLTCEVQGFGLFPHQ
jgi:uncharacterized CHY-type Zn-finger protein